MAVNGFIQGRKKFNLNQDRITVIVFDDKGKK
jgi:hypothetical protein